MSAARCTSILLVPLLAAVAAESTPVIETAPRSEPAPAPTTGPVVPVAPSAAAANSEAAAPSRAPEPSLVGDVRIMLASAPGLGTIRGATIEDDGRGGVLISPEILLRHRVADRFGYTIGAGLFLAGHTIADDITDGDYSYYAGGAQASAGLTFRIKAGWHAELRALGQLGRGKLAFSPEDDDDDDITGESGRYRALGGLGTIAYTFPIGFELGGHAGWQDFKGESEYEGVETTAEGRGMVMGVSAGFVF